MPVSWTRDEEAIYGVTDDDGSLCYLIVERLPNDSGWDWTMWRKGQPRGQMPHGVARSAEQAIEDAEACIAELITNQDFHWKPAITAGV